MKKKNIIEHIICTLLIPVVLLFTMGFSERIIAKNAGRACCTNAKCKSVNEIEKKSNGKQSNQKGSCDKIICVHFFSNNNEKKRKVPANYCC